MADSDKDILITPSTGLTTEPSIVFTGFDNNPITLDVLDAGTLSFSGSSGQLFSISDDLTGTIFSVNDISGIPSIEVIDDGTVLFAEFSGNVLIGTATDNATDKVQVNGDVLATNFKGALVGTADNAALLDNLDSTQFLRSDLADTAGDLLVASGSPLGWVNQSLAEAGISATGHTHIEADITDLQSYLLNITAEPLSDLSDVTITAIASGELLKWNGSIWINNTLAEAGISATSHNHTFDSLSNVTITAIASGEIPKWNGSIWINNTLAEAGISATGHTHLEADITDLQSYLLSITAEPLSDLSDVTITSIASNEILKWSGSAWINNTLAEAGIASSAITISSGIGLTGGGDLTANRTISMDINGLTADATPVGSTDYVVTYDASAATHKKVLLDDLPGGGSTTLVGLTDVSYVGSPAPVNGQVLLYDGSGWINSDGGGEAVTFYDYTATASQTTFSGLDDNSNTLTYVAGQILVILSGAVLDNSEYTATNGTSVVLNTGAPLNAPLNILTFGNVSVSNTYTTTESDARYVRGDVLYRNVNLTPNILSQASTTVPGITVQTYTGTGASQDIVTGMDMSSGDNGGMVWIKSIASGNHYRFDTIRGATKYITHLSSTEATDTQSLTSFNTDGFSLGTSNNVNSNGVTYVAWTFHTNRKKAGTTPRGVSYTSHYNPAIGFSMVSYVGDGNDGNSIPHHIYGGSVDVRITKQYIGSATNWLTGGSNLNISEDQYTLFNSTGGVTALTNVNINDDYYIHLETSTSTNTNTNTYMVYNFASIEGKTQYGTYTGNALTGHSIEFGFRPSWVILRNQANGNHWVTYDSARDPDINKDNALYMNSTSADVTISGVAFNDAGAELNTTHQYVNQSTLIHMYFVFAEDSTGTGSPSNNVHSTQYELVTTPTSVTVANPSTFSFANGFDAVGQLNVQKQFAGTTITLGAGYEDRTVYFYVDDDGTFGKTDQQPLSGTDRDTMDTWGKASPTNKVYRTTSLHTSENTVESGTISGSAFGTKILNASYRPWQAFDNTITGTGTDSWLALSTTTCHIGYRFTEPRVLKSWRFRSETDVNRYPKRFTIEGSNDGENWTALDSTYTASDYSTLGARQWGNLHEVGSGSPQDNLYLYMRLNSTANGGDPSYTTVSNLEFNTVSIADYYKSDEGKMYNDAGTQIQRVYFAECTTDSSGAVITLTNYSPAKIWT